MCGRFRFDNDTLIPGMERLITLLELKYPDERLPIGERFPGDPSAVLINGDGKARISKMVWGFPAKQLVINARAESAAERPMFRRSLMQKRCAVPVTGFYEWNEDKAKFFFRPKAKELLYLAGLYEDYEDGPRFVILTRDAAGSVKNVHDRMPVIIPQNMLLAWLGDVNKKDDILWNEAQPALTALEEK